MATKTLNFLEVFKESTDETLTVMKKLSINGLVFLPGTKFKLGITAGGIDLHLYRYYDLVVEEDRDTLKLVGFSVDSEDETSSEE